MGGNMTTMARILILAALAASLGAGAGGGALASSHTPASGLDNAVAAAKKELDGYDDTIDRLHKEALDAFANDNCIALNNRRNQINELRLKLRDPAFSDAFYGRHGQTIPALATASLISNVRPDLRTLRDKLEKTTSELFALRCPKVDPAQAGKTEVQVGGGVQILRRPKFGFLASEVAGSGNLQLDLVKPDRAASGPTGSVSVKTTLSTAEEPDLSGPAAILAVLLTGAIGEADERKRNATPPKRLTNTWLLGGVTHTQLRDNQIFSEIDATGGLGIQGPNGSSSGFFLASNPANIIQNAVYSANLENTGGNIAIGQTATEGGRSVSVFGSIGFNRLSSKEQFSGEIPGFMRDFAYQTDVDVNQVQLRAGAEMVQAFEQAFGMVKVGGRVEIGPDISRGRGDDSLRFTGFPTSSRNLSDSEFDVGAKLNLFAQYWPVPNNVGFIFDIGVTRVTGLPMVERDGTNPSRLDLEPGVAGYAKIGIKVRN